MKERESLGEYLRRKRESRNISLKEISKNTRIKEHILQAIEEERFDILNPIYIKGFLLTYAKYLELPPEEIILRLEGIEALRHNIKLEMAPQRRFSKRLRKILILVMMIVITLILSYFIHSFKSKESISVKGKKEEFSSPKEIKSISQPEGRFFRLKLRTIEKTWLRVKVNGEMKKEMVLQPGEVLSYGAKDKIYLWIGNAGGIDLIFNEKELEKFGKSGEVVRLIFSTEGVERISPGHKEIENDYRK